MNASSLKKSITASALRFSPLRKAGRTESLRATFRINPREAISADGFTSFVENPDNFIEFSAALISAMNAETRSVLEFRSATDVSIANKMLAFPALGEKREGIWNLKLTNEFHMANDGKTGIFKKELGLDRLPLFTGRMFNQFEVTAEHSGFWIDEAAGRRALLGRTPDTRPTDGLPELSVVAPANCPVH
jgi:hypothetical protein